MYILYLELRILGCRFRLRKEEAPALISHVSEAERFATVAAAAQKGSRQPADHQFWKHDPPVAYGFVTTFNWLSYSKYCVKSLGSITYYHYFQGAIPRQLLGEISGNSNYREGRFKLRIQIT